MLTHLLLMRHAKSSWNDPNQTDHERPLNARGRRAAPAVGQALHARGYAPQVIWASDSKRTRETALHLIRAIPGAQRIDYYSEFYHASPSDVFAVARREGEPDVERLMWLGHNPGWGDMHAQFTGRYDDYPTGACTVLERTHEGDWLNPDSWKFVDLILPRLLEA
ncbi:histidine phosphatase family protein [Algimonas porphyrae]|uniref:Phosphoglycerate mutase n=1 Tax=Algimonas porphyrae TaxID=1128113 RepID=A0ABQ5UZF5_9PROT|nr:histidine phosphatase family protein [Algimonas porphyrae]GLQ19357.1 phosphoglycerate mutase [Algimonas porphyrae]